MNLFSGISVMCTILSQTWLSLTKYAYMELVNITGMIRHMSIWLRDDMFAQVASEKFVTNVTIWSFWSQAYGKL